MTRRITRWVVLLLVGLSPALAAADDHARARTLFEEGTAALRQGNLEQGRDLLRESLALHPRPSTRFNLAVALRRTGQLLEAVELLEELAARDSSELSAAQRDEVELQLKEVRAEIPTLRVGVRKATSATIRVNGREVGSVSGSMLDVPVDPGTHRVEADAEGLEPASRTVEVERGDTTSVVLEPATVVPSPAEVAADPPETDAPGPSRVDTAPRDEMAAESGFPWGWLAVGIALVGGAVAATVLLLDRDGPEPTRDPVTGLAITLR